MMKKMVVVGLCAAGVAICQQPKFELADVHSSKTSRSAAQNFGGVLRAGKYVNRDVTMLGLIEAAYKVKKDAIAGGPVQAAGQARNASDAAVCAHGGQGRVEAQAGERVGTGLPAGAAAGWGPR